MKTDNEPKYLKYLNKLNNISNGFKLTHNIKLSEELLNIRNNLENCFIELEKPVISFRSEHTQKENSTVIINRWNIASQEELDHMVNFDFSTLDTPPFQLKDICHITVWTNKFKGYCISIKRLNDAKSINNHTQYIPIFTKIIDNYIYYKLIIYGITKDKLIELVNIKNQNIEDGFHIAFKHKTLRLKYNTKRKVIKKDKILDKITSKSSSKKIRNSSSCGLGLRRSTPRPSNTKFKTGIKYVTFHYAFGNIQCAPLDSRNFAIRAYIAKSDINPIGIHIKDFELNDNGIINARYYIDESIRYLGLDIPLYFKQKDYEFIYKYGPKIWIKATKFKSNFEFGKHKDEIIRRYFDVLDRFAIKESFSIRLIVDNSPDIDLEDIPQIELKSLIKLK